MYHIFFIHSSVHGHLGCFHVLVVVNIAAMNTGVYVSFRIVIFSGYMPIGRIAESYGNLQISWRRKWQPTPVYLPGKFHGQRNLAGYSPWGYKE